MSPAPPLAITVTIRDATLADAPGIFALAAALAHEAPVYEGEDVDAEVLAENIEAAIAHEGAAVIVAEAEGAIVGVIGGVVTRSLICRALHLGELALFVLPAARKAGVASRLIEAFEAWGESLGASKALIEAGGDPAHTEAVSAFFGRHGYRPIGRTHLKTLGG